MKNRIGLIALFSIMGAMSASASLVMKIDTANDEFYFEGSVSGTPYDDGYGGEMVSFEIAGDYDFASTTTFFCNSCFEGGPTLMIDMNEFLTKFWGAGPAGDTLDTLTAKGDTATVSYASLSSVDQTVFESMIGDTLSLGLMGGTGYSDISIQAVPEPATLGLMVVAGGVVYLRRRSKLRDFS